MIDREDGELAAIHCLVVARDELSKIRNNGYLRFQEEKCDSCGLEAKNPKSHWIALQAVESGWNRVNRALKEFGASHLLPADFSENGSAGSPETRDLDATQPELPPETEQA